MTCGVRKVGSACKSAVFAHAIELTHPKESFNSLFEAQLLLEDWRLEYNHYRPHQSLNYQTPVEYARRWTWRTDNQPELSCFLPLLSRRLGSRRRTVRGAVLVVGGGRRCTHPRLNSNAGCTSRAAPGGGRPPRSPSRARRV